MGIGNLGISELLIIAVIVLIFFGPSRLPEIGRSVGGALREFKKGMNEVKRELEEVERRAKGEGEDRSDGQGDRPAGRVSPPRSIDDAPTFGSGPTARPTEEGAGSARPEAEAEQAEAEAEQPAADAERPREESAAESERAAEETDAVAEGEDDAEERP